MCKIKKGNLTKFLVVDNLLFDHVGLPHVLDLAVHLVHLSTWIALGGHPETFSLEYSSMVKSWGWWWWVAYVIIVSPQSQLDFNF